MQLFSNSKLPRRGVFLALLFFCSAAFCDVRVQVEMGSNPRNLRVNTDEAVEFFEAFFKHEVGPWTDGRNIQGPYPLRISVNSSAQSLSNGQFARGSIRVLLGRDLPDELADRGFQLIAAHEVAHVIFEKMAGLAGYESVSPFHHLENVVGRHSGYRFLILAANEFFADTLAYCVTGDDEMSVLFRGPAGSFTQTLPAAQLNPNNPYEFFSLARKTMGDRCQNMNADYSDLGRLYSALILFLEGVQKSELDTLSSVDTMQSLNERLTQSLKTLSQYPLPHKLPRGPIRCSDHLLGPPAP